MKMASGSHGNLKAWWYKEQQNIKPTCWHFGSYFFPNCRWIFERVEIVHLCSVFQDHKELAAWKAVNMFQWFDEGIPLLFTHILFLKPFLLMCRNHQTHRDGFLLHVSYLVSHLLAGGFYIEMLGPSNPVQIGCKWRMSRQHRYQRSLNLPLWYLKAASLWQETWALGSSLILTQTNLRVLYFSFLICKTGTIISAWIHLWGCYENKTQENKGYNTLGIVK